MKTVGIITCHTPQNYGAMLQAYALQYYLKSINCSPEIINYFPENFSKELSLWHVANKTIRRNFIKKILYIIVKLPKRIKRQFDFGRFRNKYINIGKHRYYSYDELKKECPKYDMYICGSDQIWNTRGVRGWDPVFYLQFVQDKTICHSYAASMSLDIPVSSDVKKMVIPMIEELNNISVREKLIHQTLSSLISKTIHYNLDPVYLLSDKDWLCLADDGTPLKRDYILIYPMGDGSHVVENAKRLAAKTGLPIYCITASSKKFHGVNKHINCSVTQFVTFFRNAAYVITNSFHGTSFSIIFRRNFWACEVSANNHRITNILKEFNLFDRYISKNDTIDIDRLSIDYSKAIEPLETHIKQSKQYLYNIVNG